MHVVVMGPSGAGKSAVGAALAALLGLPFADADDLHPAANVAKMTAGTPLDDDDRMPWLDLVGAALRDAPALVVACSALARCYRERILRVVPDVRFVCLAVPRDELDRRMRQRSHFMSPALLESQLTAWEPLQPDEPGVTIDNTGDLEEVVSRAAAALRDQSLR